MLALNYAWSIAGSSSHSAVPICGSSVQEQRAQAIRAQVRRCANSDPISEAFPHPAPNALAVRLASDLLDVLEDHGVSPMYALASPEGGITLSFFQDLRHAAIEVHNDGIAVGVISHLGAPPEIWEFDPDDIADASGIERLASFLKS